MAEHVKSKKVQDGFVESREEIVILQDKEGSKHTCPLSVALSLEEIATRVEKEKIALKGKSDNCIVILDDVSGEVLHYILRFQQVCVCHLVEDLKKVQLTRDRLVKEIQLEETGLSQEIRKAAESLGANAMVVLMDYAEEMSDLESVIAAEEKERHAAFDRKLKASTENPILKPLRPLKEHEEQLMGTMNIKNITWARQGAPEEDDLSFGWVDGQKKEEVLDVQEMVSNARASPELVQHPEEIL